MKVLNSTSFEVVEFEKEPDRILISINDKGNVYTVTGCTVKEHAEILVYFKSYFSNDETVSKIAIKKKDFLDLKSIVLRDDKVAIKEVFNLLYMLVN